MSCPGILSMQLEFTENFCRSGKAGKREDTYSDESVKSQQSAYSIFLRDIVHQSNMLILIACTSVMDSFLQHKFCRFGLSQ